VARRAAEKRAVLFAALASVVLGGALASPPEARRRTVLISFDAVGGQKLERLLADPSQLTAGGYRRIAARGVIAGRSVPPTPALTAVSHIVIATGALPQATGIVSNTMLDRSKPFGATVSGFDALIRADTLWEAARRQGKRVGVMLYVGVDGTTPSRTADWAITWPGDPSTRGKVWTLAAASWFGAEGGAEKSFTPARRVALAFGSTGHSLAAIAIDSTDDGHVNYDHLRIQPEAGAAIDVKPGDWFPAEIRADDGRTGAWCKLLSLASDLSRVEIYLGPLGRNTGYPKEFVREIDGKFGFWPGAPDARSFPPDSERGQILLEQADRLAAYITQQQLDALARPDWDLLLCYQPEVDEISHEFFLTDPGQPDFTWERAARFGSIVDRAYAIADRSLDSIERALAPSDSIFVTSDHGMTAVWTELFPNEILREAGFLKADAKRQIDPSSPSVAVVDAGIAHIFLNAGVDRSVLDRIEALFAAFRVRGESPWDKIVRREDAGPYGQNAPESGDLIVLLKPGFHFSKRLPDSESPVGIPTEHGAHGYSNASPQLHASFLAAGPGIAHEKLASINSWQIAARVAAALGIDPPRNASR
jgi:predicted AlkP superfamily pyrophosphatase or phosphodiesterase